MEGSIGYSKYPTESLILLQDYPGAYSPEGLDIINAKLGGRFGRPFAILKPYLSAGVAVYHISVEERRFDDSRSDFANTYPGVYTGTGIKIKISGPVSADVFTCYSYLFGTDKEDDRINRLSTVDFGFGLAIDIQVISALIFSPRLYIIPIKRGEL